MNFFDQQALKRRQSLILLACFLLTMVATKRVKQLYKGAQPLIENKSNNRKVVLALREIAAGKIEYEIPVRK